MSTADISKTRQLTPKQSGLINTTLQVRGQISICGLGVNCLFKKNIVIVTVIQNINILVKSLVTYHSNINEETPSPKTSCSPSLSVLL